MGPPEVNRVLVKRAIVIVLLCVSVAQAATNTDEGIRLYKAERFEEAAELFERAVAEEPDNADIHHRLGLAHAYSAERASWFTALGHATSARESFERAVALDPRHKEALRDLMKFYLAAPAFLGGSCEDAAALAQRLMALDTAYGDEAKRLVAEADGCGVDD